MKEQENRENQEMETYQDESENQSKLDLDYSVLESRNTSSYVSLTDLYFLSVFTDGFREKMIGYQIEESQTNHNLKQKIFVSERTGTKDFYDELAAAMFADKTTLILKESNVVKAKQNSLGLYMAGGIVWLLFSLILIQYYMKKRKERMAHVNHSDNSIYEVS